ncbi:MAG TPA: hypothetical protein VFV38_35565 [Ktedonobacteraceae bacterium]|nr:hypothetical protein [Ktedonobacteraceae bacterium]
MQDLNILCEELIVWAQKNVLEKVSLEHFSRCFEHYQEEDGEEFARYFRDFQSEELEVGVQSISYCIHLPDDIPNIILYLNIVYRDEEVAKYTISFSLSGEIVDDCFYLSYPKKVEEIHELSSHL